PEPSALTVAMLDAHVHPAQYVSSPPHQSPGWAVQWYVVRTNAIIVPAVDWMSSEVRGRGGPSGRAASSHAARIRAAATAAVARAVIVVIPDLWNGSRSVRGGEDLPTITPAISLP